MAVVSNVLRPGAAKANPLTICIVANPALETPWNSGNVVQDPIIGNLPAFQAAATYIDSSLFCLLPGEKENVLAGRCERFQPDVIHPAEYFYGFTFSGRIANLIPLGFTLHGRSRGF